MEANGIFRLVIQITNDFFCFGNGGCGVLAVALEGAFVAFFAVGHAQIMAESRDDDSPAVGFDAEAFKKAADPKGSLFNGEGVFAGGCLQMVFLGKALPESGGGEDRAAKLCLRRLRHRYASGFRIRFNHNLLHYNICLWQQTFCLTF